MKNKNLIGEVWDYFKIRKKWWLLPIIILSILIGIIGLVLILIWFIIGGEFI